MKLSKSQRLFVRIGRIDYYLSHIKSYYKYDERVGLTVDCYTERLKQLKELRKKLIREALIESAEEHRKSFDLGLAVGCDWEV